VTGTVQQVLVTEPAPLLTRHLIAVANRHLSLKQQASGGFLVVAAGSAVRRGVRADAQPASEFEGNLWVCGRALPALHGLSIIRGWTGINPPSTGRPFWVRRRGCLVLEHRDGEWLHARTDCRAADGGGDLHGEAVDPHYRLERFDATG